MTEQKQKNERPPFAKTRNNPDLSLEDFRMGEGDETFLSLEGSVPPTQSTSPFAVDDISPSADGHVKDDFSADDDGATIEMSSFLASAQERGIPLPPISSQVVEAIVDPWVAETAAYTMDADVIKKLDAAYEVAASRTYPEDAEEEESSQEPVLTPSPSHWREQREAAKAQQGHRVLADRYAVLEKIGEGASGEVFRVRDLEVGDVIALKLLSEEHSKKKDNLERFRREVRLSRQVTHRNIARIFDLGRIGKRYYLTMELIQGRSLDALIEEGGLSFLQICQMLRLVCLGLQAAHEVGVVHRDLKPENLLVEGSGRVVISDFGIARREADPSIFKTTDGSVLGTPAYMAPEQITLNGKVDHRADIFALGAILYEMLTGKPAAKEENLMDLLVSRLKSPPPDPRDVRAETPEALAALSRECMALDPDNRPQDVKAVIARLDQIMAHLEQEDVPSLTLRARGFAGSMLSLFGSKKSG